MTTEYEVQFSIEGVLVIKADSPEDAERKALSIIEDPQFDAEDSDIDSGTVKAVGRYKDSDSPFRDADDLEPIERAPKVMEFCR